MVDLTTTYLGLELRSPLVVSACPLTGDLDTLRALADAGAGAVVLPSLFEEQIILQSSGLRDQDIILTLPPELRHVPDMQGYNQGVGGYLAHLYRAKKVLDIPVIASLNGVSKGGWLSHARLLEEVGADALELNIYYLPTETYVGGGEIEGMYERLVTAVRETVSIPVAVKLSPYFSAMANMANRLALAGAGALVLFNRFYQPDIDITTESIEPNLQLSDPSELRLRLRWVALLHERVRAQLAVTGGVHRGEDALKALLAGADVVMLASALLRHGPGHLAIVEREMREWLDEREVTRLDEIRGRLSQKRAVAPSALERANYMNVLQSYTPSSA